MPTRSACRLAALLLALSGPAWAETMRVLESSPSARSTMDGNRQDFFVRFDRPVDHGGSRLLLLRDGAVVRSLAPRLGASPETLYAAAGGLPPGRYTLRWEARSRADGTVTAGGLDFELR